LGRVSSRIKAEDADGLAAPVELPDVELAWLGNADVDRGRDSGEYRVSRLVARVPVRDMAVWRMKMPSSSPWRP